MLTLRYLNGADVDPFEGFPGVYAYAISRGGTIGWRYLSSYADGKRYKDAIFTRLRRYGQGETPMEWDLHHIVERTHLANLRISCNLIELYEEHLPCVLIHKPHHQTYNQLLNIRATDELFGLNPRASLPRHADTLPATTSTQSLKANVERLRHLYFLAYEGDAVLQRIASNVLDHALAQFK